MGSLSHAHGSAVVRTGDTTVICGVGAEILPAASIPNHRPRTREELLQGDGRLGREELRDYDLLVPNIELATGCAPQFLPGVPPTTLAQTLSTRVYSLLHSCGLLDAEDLRIWYRRPRAEAEEGGAGDGDRMDEEEDGADDADEAEVKAYWVLYIDVLFISFDGNPFDAAWAAILAALRDTRLPVARWDPDRDMVVCSRTAREQMKELSIRGLPIACTGAVFLEKKETGSTRNTGKHWLLADPDRLEESLCDESVTVVVDRATGNGNGETRVRNVTKNGGTVVGPQMLREFVKLAEKRWDEFQKIMS